MFIGHFALGFAAKRVVPRVSLAVLFAAVAWADLIWPILLAVGIEHVRIDPGNTVVTPLDFVSYPYSHSLLILALWGLALGLAYRTITGKNGLTVTVLTLLVVSHWVLDFVTHRPDMPLYPGGDKFGVGLWNSPRATVAIEVAMYAVGVWIYTRATRPRDGIGRWSFVSFVMFLLVAYAANLAGGPPPSITVLYLSAIGGTALLLVWSWWLDAHRVATAAPLQ